MFVLSVNASKRRVIPLLLCVALAAAMLVATLVFPAARTVATTTVTAAGQTDEDCAAFLKTLGLTAELPCVSVREIRLPDSFDEHLTAYNELQKTAGFDLLGYAGQRVKYRTYDLAEHPSGLPSQVHLYTCNGMIIGGDIAAENGEFVQPLQLIAEASC